MSFVTITATVLYLDEHSISIKARSEHFKSSNGYMLDIPNAFKAGKSILAVIDGEHFISKSYLRNESAVHTFFYYDECALELSTITCTYNQIRSGSILSELITIIAAIKGHSEVLDLESINLK